MDESPLPTTITPLPKIREKPIDRWLGLASAAAGIILFLVPKTPLIAVVLSFVVFALMVHPLLNFYWIEKTKTRKLIAILFWTVSCIVIGRVAWTTIPPPQTTAAEIVDEMDRRKKSDKSTSAIDKSMSPSQLQDKSATPKNPMPSRKTTLETLPPGPVDGRLSMSVSPTATKMLMNEDQLVAFSVTNPAARDAYSVAVLLTVEGSAEVTPDDFELILPPSSKKPLFDRPLENGHMPNDIMGIIGRDDQQRAIVLINIFRLVPNERRDFEVLSKKKGPSRISATASGSLEQMPRISRENFKAMPIFVPLKISVNKAIY
jgi:hypothetical protein